MKRNVEILPSTRVAVRLLVYLAKGNVISIDGATYCMRNKSAEGASSLNHIDVTHMTIEKVAELAELLENKDRAMILAYRP